MKAPMCGHAEPCQSCADLDRVCYCERDDRPDAVLSYLDRLDSMHPDDVLAERIKKLRAERLATLSERDDE